MAPRPTHRGWFDSSPGNPENEAPGQYKTWTDPEESSNTVFGKKGASDSFTQLPHHQLHRWRAVPFRRAHAPYQRQGAHRRHLPLHVPDPRCLLPDGPVRELGHCQAPGQGTSGPWPATSTRGSLSAKATGTGSRSAPPRKAAASASSPRSGSTARASRPAGRSTPPVPTRPAGSVFGERAWAASTGTI